MILKNLKVLDIERIGNTDAGVQAGISAENLPFVFDLVSNRLYSNPIGSIVREITSNCFDSHIEAGIDDPVIIRKGYDAEEGHYIEFQDFGVGMSPETMNTIYVNYFSSTKRETNDQIGAFGLGSKTPLAYADLFYIVTIFNGTEYSYIYHKGESKPTLELLSESSTSNRNGTTIKIIVEDNDRVKFREELKDQLLYFDNVYFDGWNINNNYTIYEGEYFKFRSDIPQDNVTSLHICIGKVKYPIDFRKIKLGQLNYKNIPVAVKFEIGELQMTPSREDIKYDAESIKKIEDRIELMVSEITDLFNSKNPIVDTLREYDAIDSLTPQIVFDEARKHALYLWSKTTLSKEFKFRPLIDTGIKKTPKQLFFLWEKVGYIDSFGVFKPQTYNFGITNSDIYNENAVILGEHDRISMYTSLNLYRQVGSKFVIRKKKYTDQMHNISGILGLNSSKAEQNKARIIYQYNKVIDKMVYDNLSTYESFRPSDEWISAYKKEQRESTLAYRRKMNKEVFLREAPRWDGKNCKVSTLNNRTGIMVYGFREDKMLLYDIWDIITDCVNSIQPKVRSSSIKKEAFRVIQISKSIEKDIIGATKTIYCRDFLKTKFFRKVYYGYWLHGEISEISENNLKRTYINNFSKDIDEARKIAYLLCKSPKQITSYNISLFPDDIEVPKDIKRLAKELHNKYDNLKMPFENSFAYNNIPTNDEEEYVQYLKHKKYRLKNKFYLKTQRQLEYEKAVKEILNEIKNPKQYLLLTFKNQTENGNINEETSL